MKFRIFAFSVIVLALILSFGCSSSGDDDDNDDGTDDDDDDDGITARISFHDSSNGKVYAFKNGLWTEELFPTGKSSGYWYIWHFAQDNSSFAIAHFNEIVSGTIAILRNDNGQWLMEYEGSISRFAFSESGEVFAYSHYGGSQILKRVSNAWQVEELPTFEGELGIEGFVFDLDGNAYAWGTIEDDYSYLTNIMLSNHSGTWQEESLPPETYGVSKILVGVDGTMWGRSNYLIKKEGTSWVIEDLPFSASSSWSIQGFNLNPINGEPCLVVEVDNETHSFLSKSGGSWSVEALPEDIFYHWNVKVLFTQSGKPLIYTGRELLTKESGTWTVENFGGILSENLNLNSATTGPNETTWVAGVDNDSDNQNVDHFIIRKEGGTWHRDVMPTFPNQYAGIKHIGFSQDETPWAWGRLYELADGWGFGTMRDCLVMRKSEGEWISDTPDTLEPWPVDTGGCTFALY